MPSTRGKHSRYKIPDTILPSGICCVCVPVPDDTEYKAQFLGAIWRMSLQTHYERDEAKSGKEVAARWRVVYEEVRDNMTCCQGTVNQNYIQIQIYQNSVRNLLQQLYLTYIEASLDIQVAFVGVPDEYDADPGDVGDEINQRNLALCIACRSFVDQVCNDGMLWIEGAMVDGIPIMTGAIAMPFIPMPVSILIGLYAAFVGAVSWNELSREDYREYLTCGMYQALKGAATTDQDGFDACFDSLPARPPPSENAAQDDARDIIEAWLRSLVNDLENYLGFASVLNAAYSVAATLSFDDCPCADWEMTWIGGENEAGDWDLKQYNAGHGFTTYNAGDDRFEGDCTGPNEEFGARVSITFAATTITRIRATCAFEGDRTSGGNKSDIGDDADHDKHTSLAHGLGPGTHDIDTGAILEVETNISISSAATTFDCISGGYAYITSITINGKGENPFV